MKLLGIQTLADVRDRCRVDSDSGCWVWAGAYSTCGKGRSRVPVASAKAIGKNSASVYRIAWELKHGQAPAQKHVVWARCRAEGCCNPEHLVTGNRARMFADMARNGAVYGGPAQSARTARRSRERSRFTMADIEEMRASGLSAMEVSKRWLITYGNAWNILTGRTWNVVRGASVFAQ